MIPRSSSLTSLIVVLALALVPVTAQATTYIWTGDSSTTHAWDFNTNWGASSTAFPNAYTDTATLTTTTNWPATIGIGTTNTIHLGASGAALTTTGTGATTVALDIASSGVLGMKGNIANTRRITVEGTLSNDDSGAHTISGTGNILLNGGILSSAGGGSWTLGQAVNGYGTISSPFTNTSTITANSSGNTLHITGSSTAGGGLSSTSGAILSLQSAITGANVASGNAGEIALNGATLTNFTQNAASGTIQVTGNSTSQRHLRQKQLCALHSQRQHPQSVRGHGERRDRGARVICRRDRDPE